MVVGWPPMTAGMSPVSYCVSPPGREMPATPQVRCLLYSQARLLTCMDAHKFCLSHEGRVDLWAMRSRVEAEPGAVPGPILEEVSGARCSRMDSGTGVHPRGRSGVGDIPEPRLKAQGVEAKNSSGSRVCGHTLRCTLGILWVRGWPLTPFTQTSSSV